MFSFVNRTVFDIPLTWNRTRFETTRAKCRQARKLIEISINVQYERQLRNVYVQNFDLEKTITELNKDVQKRGKKVSIFDNLTEIASETLPTFVDKRMEKLRCIIQENFSTIERALEEENRYWKEIHCAIDQNLITSDDIHPPRQTISTVDDEENSIEILSYKPPSTTNVDHRISTKKERISAVLNSDKSNQIIPGINKTYHIKLQNITNNDTSRTLSMDDSSSHIPSIDTDTLPMYSQPNPPAPFIFSPTLLHDELSESTKNILSPMDQNVKPKLILNRVSQELLRSYLQIKDADDIQSNDCLIQSKSTDSIESESNGHQQNSFAFPKSISKLRSRSTTKNESESISPTIDIKPTRKRKQSASEETNSTLSTITLRKRKPFSFAEIDEIEPKQKLKKKRKYNRTKENEIPSRETSPLLTIDRLTNFSTQFSTRSQRSNSFTSSTNDVEIIDDNGKTKNRSQRREKLTNQKSNQSKNSTKKSKKI